MLVGGCCWGVDAGGEGLGGENVGEGEGVGGGREEGWELTTGVGWISSTEGILEDEECGEHLSDLCRAAVVLLEAAC